LQCFVIYEDPTKIYTRLVTAIFDSAVKRGKKNRSSKVIENLSILSKEGRRESKQIVVLPDPFCSTDSPLKGSCIKILYHYNKQLTFK
jgi:hypothetical protein